MKNKGIVRNLDPLGRIVIPKEMRKKLDIKQGDEIEIQASGSTIILKKYKPNCIICDSDKDLQEIEGKLICKKCIEKITREEK